MLRLSSPEVFGILMQVLLDLVSSFTKSCTKFWCHALHLLSEMTCSFFKTYLSFSQRIKIFRTIRNRVRGSRFYTYVCIRIRIPGLEKYHRGIGVVVIFAAAAITAVRTFLDKQHGVKLEFHGLLFQIRMFQIDDACLGMQCLASQTAVAFAHVLYVQRIFHLLFHLPFQLIILARYSFGVHPSRFLNRRHRCCGYWNPNEYAIWLTVSRVPTIRSFAISITFS